MNLHERERLIIGIVSALVIHAAVFLGIEFAGLRPSPIDDITPVFVELLDYVLPETEPETPPEPEIEPVEPEPEIEPEEPEPIDPPPPDRETTPPPVTGTGPRSRNFGEHIPAAAANTDAPSGSHSQDDLEWLEDSGTGRERPPTPGVLDDINEPSSDGTVPEGFEVLPPIVAVASLDSETRASLDDLADSIPGFTDRLERIVDQLNDERAYSFDTSAESSGVERDPAANPDSLPGSSEFTWIDGAERGPIGLLARPDVTNEDYGEFVDAVTRVLVIFEVLDSGLVRPDSVIFRQSSGRLAVDQKIREAINKWQFQLSPGADPVTVICKLILERE